MTKVMQMTLPPAFQALLDKILAHFDQTIYPTWATRNFHLTRAAKAANKEKTYLPTVRSLWGALSPTTKALWKSCAAFMQYSSYQYFTAKYSYIRKHITDPALNPYLIYEIVTEDGVNLLTEDGNALACDPYIVYMTPTVLHQMEALFSTNPGGVELVQWVRDDVVLMGQVSVEFVYKKIEYTGYYGSPFGLHIDAYYFEGGENKVDTYDWAAPDGTVDWSAVQFSFGVTSRNYFHVVCTWSLDYYDADVFFDNLLISDQLGPVHRQAFWVKAGKTWVYTPHYRKQGWAFWPSFTPAWFDVVYSD